MENINIKTEKDCTGCGACSQTCPKQCIEMIENERGFLVPKADLTKCIECGLCLKKCPINNNANVNVPITSYAAFTTNNIVLKASTSGGAFYEISKFILNNNGVVFGCSWNENLLPHHIKVDNLENLEKIMQSKYVQSNTGNTFKDAKSELENKKIVLYSGTACQIAGLLNFLGKQYSNLYTIEIACHGVPSPGLFSKYKKWLENKEKDKIKKFKFRNKEKHKTGEHYMFCVEYNHKGKKYYYYNTDPYYDSFLSGKTLRETCYNCKFKGPNRIADFTIADYWGLEKKYKSFPAYNGVSAIIINTTKAKEIFEKIQDNFYFIETTVDDVYKYNTSLIKSSKDVSIKYNLNDSDLIEKMVPKVSVKKIVKNIVPGKIKYYIKRIFK